VIYDTEDDQISKCLSIYTLIKVIYILFYHCHPALAYIPSSFKFEPLILFISCTVYYFQLTRLLIVVIIETLSRICFAQYGQSANFLILIIF